MDRSKGTEGQATGCGTPRPFLHHMARVGACRELEDAAGGRWKRELQSD